MHLVLLFLVVKLEKVLQGDMSEAIEPYIKEERNVEKVRAAAVDACGRLGQFRMPFCWTAIELAKIVRALDTRVKNFKVYKGCEDTVKNMMTSLPLVGDLAHPSMRERHWKKVVEITGGSPADMSLVDRFPELPIGRVRQEGQITGHVQPQQPRARLCRGLGISSLTGCRRKRFQSTLGKAIDIGRLAEAQCPALGGIQNVVAELG